MGEDGESNPGLDAIDRLDDGSSFWEAQRQDLIRAGKPKEIDGLFFEHNQQGQKFEKAGDLENAIKAYRANVNDERLNAISTFPHDRLLVLYRKQKDYDNEISVIERLLTVSSRFVSFDVSKYQKRLQTALSLKRKATNS